MDMWLSETGEMRDRENQVQGKRLSAWIRQIFTPPMFEDEDETRRANLLNIILLAGLAVTGMVGIGLLSTSPDPGPGLVAAGLLVLSELSALFLLRRGRVQFASWLLSCVLAVFFMVVTFLFGGVQISSFSSYVVVILISALLLGGRAGALFAGLGSMAGLGILCAEIAGLLPPSPMPVTPAFTWVTVTAAFMMTAVLLHLATAGLDNALERARRNAHALAESNRQLRRENAERVQTEKALRESEERFRSIFENATIGLYRTTPDGRVLMANPALLRMLGYSSFEGLAQRRLEEEGYAPEYPRSDFKQRVESEGQINGLESAWVRRDGTTVFVRESARAIRGESGDTLYYEGTVEDITERRRAEEALRAYAARLERSNRELQDFLYVASHDLQEPLRKVQAFGDRLQTAYSEVLDDQGRDYLERMQNAAARMQTLINSLLTYSRVTTKAEPFVPVDLDRVVREVVSDLETRIEQVGGRVEVGDLPTIEADPTQMRQLLQNLIGNALKFHKENEAPLVKVYAEPLDGRDGWYQIMVEDNGIGFDEKYLERIFQVFQRLHGRDKYEGTGIGLATCRKIVERHRGSITAKSVPAQGATFIVTLPIKQFSGDEGR